MLAIGSLPQDELSLLYAVVDAGVRSTDCFVKKLHRDDGSMFVINRTFHPAVIPEKLVYDNLDVVLIQVMFWVLG